MFSCLSIMMISGDLWIIIFFPPLIRVWYFTHNANVISGVPVLWYGFRNTQIIWTMSYKMNIFIGLVRDEARIHWMYQKGNQNPQIEGHTM